MAELEYTRKVEIIAAGRLALSQIEEFIPGLSFVPIPGSDTDFYVHDLTGERLGRIVSDIGVQFVTIRWRPLFGKRNLAAKRRWRYDHTDGFSDKAGFINFITGIQRDLGL